MNLSDAKSRMLAAIIGLVRASVENDTTTSQTEPLLKEALIAVSSGSDYECEQIITSLHTEKRVLAPGCADCTSPCGRTADYTKEEFISEPQDVRELKAELLFGVLGNLAGNYSGICKKLFIFGYERDADRLREFLRDKDEVE